MVQTRMQGLKLDVICKRVSTFCMCSLIKENLRAKQRRSKARGSLILNLKLLIGEFIDCFKLIMNIQRALDCFKLLYTVHCASLLELWVLRTTCI